MALKKKFSYSTRIVQLKKGINEVQLKGDCTIQNLCPFDIRISFNKDWQGIYLAHKAIRNYSLDIETVYIKAIADSELVVEEAI